MTHLAFITIFLGLVMGPHDVEMKVTGPVASVELRLDGQRIIVMTGAPWKASIDFGPGLIPHTLEARAVDADGNEVAHAGQTVNLPHPNSELQLVLERDDRRRPVAVHVLWRSLESSRPKKMFATLDNEPLVLDENNRAALPKVDLDTPHVLRGRSIAPSGIPASTEIAFGGGLEDQTGAKLTPIVIRLTKKGAEPTPNDIERALRLGDAAVKVAAVEKGEPQVLVVRHPVRTETAMRLDPGSLRRNKPRPRISPGAEDVKTLTFVWPVARDSDVHASLFEWSSPAEFATAADLQTLLATISGPYDTKLLFSRAVAVAGVRAVGSREPRAVVLIVGESDRDAGGMSKDQARGYLRSVGVPLYVWSLGVDASGWGDASDITSPGGYRRAFEQLEADLRSQRIVWVEGDHLPGDIRSVSGEIETLAKR